MKFPLSWLYAHLGPDASGHVPELPAITAALDRIGLEVEGVSSPADDLKGFRIGHILSAEPHPDADRLQVCQVDVGEGAPVQVVCGAPNARPGLKVIFAPPGTYVPGADITIKAGAIRGQKSGGMMCSLRELGLGTAHDGIAELPAQAPTGADYATWAELDDPVLDIAITPDRGDALGVRGVARDLAAAGCGQLRPLPEAEPQASTPFTPDDHAPLTWVKNHDGVLVAAGRVVRGVKNGPSPEWLKKRLQAAGIQPKNALVDVTNYIMLAFNRPLHVFDAAKVTGSTLELRAAQAGEVFTALDGVERHLKGGEVVIADGAGVQSLAGIMGGATTGVDEGTTDVFIESAVFDPVAVALAGRLHSLESDARYRFERAIDPASALEGLEAATALITQLSGGAPGKVVTVGKVAPPTRTATMHFVALEELGGVALTPDEVVSALERLGFNVLERDGQAVKVAVPSWRPHIAPGVTVSNPLAQAPSLPEEARQQAASSVEGVEAEAQLVAEVLRLRGLDDIAPKPLPPLPADRTPKVPAAFARDGRLRQAMAGRGMVEAISFSFTSSGDAELFGGPVHSGHRLLNPIASDLDVLRPTPLPNLLRALSRNLARSLGKEGDAALFEVGPAFTAQGVSTTLAGVRGGSTARCPGQRARAFGWRDSKADLMAALAALGIDEGTLTIVPLHIMPEGERPPHYHPGRSGQVRRGPKQVLGTFGELHPTTAKALGLDGKGMEATLALFELDAEAAQPAKATGKKRKSKQPSPPPLSPFQPVRRDFAFITPATVPVQDILAAARKALRALPVKGVKGTARLFDLFEGAGLGAGERSTGIEVILVPERETLQDEAIELMANHVEQVVAQSTGATLRR
ncbi:phenylalanine--tRNA ligase subunit beta [Formicincola oecophyllae]|uniref:Phenylalanine--tRNA ligase beta subunit n=1 Tax=Formicincola oecophyllae TaxID=2558361 RepID=A0A4Y6U7V3_9PROT|nr:phenylalanine--tRNA ligase subunit beta [Formicincola oecophyllae]QDH13080.1 phenylalanine--tRNA ligase subunit beta [Formicincola oecophyllae]